MLRAPAIVSLLALLYGCTGSMKGPPAGGTSPGDGDGGASSVGLAGGGGSSGSTCTAPFVVAAPDSGPIDLSMDAGTCGDACAGTCLASGCVETLALLANMGTALVGVDSTSVYWTSWGIWTAPLDGGAPISLAPANPVTLVVAPPDVYWTNTGVGPLAEPILDTRDAVPIDGGPVTRLASAASSPVRFQGLAVDATYVYWTQRTNLSPSDGGLDREGAVLRIPRSGGAVVTMASGQNNPTDIAVDATSVYWLNTSAGTVMKMPVSGGSPVTLAAGQDVPAHIAIDSTNVYWTDLADGVDAGASGSIVTVPICGGTARTLASNRTEPYSIAVDARNVYWTELSLQDGILAVPRTGGATTTLVSGPCAFVAADGKSVYWSESPDSPDASGTVRKLTLR